MLLLFEGIYFYFLTKKFRKKEIAMEKRKRLMSPQEGDKVCFDFKGHGEEIEGSFNFNKSPENKLKPGEIHIVEEVLPDGNVVLLDTGLLSFAPKFLIVLCEEEGCSGEMFCTDGLCRNCFIIELAKRNIGELV